jgi:L-lactate dehydrogenase complex protein LldG
MSSKEKILAAVLENQPQLTPLPDIGIFKGKDQDIVQKYSDTFTSIGGRVFLVDGIAAVKAIIIEQFDINKRIITTLPQLDDTAELYSSRVDPHTFDDVELAVIKAQLAVAENGAVWLTEQLMGQRILPYICQHLAVIVSAESFVPTMHEAYTHLGVGQYGFGAFIGGPSKTADIEQSLVMGAHGPITMTVFVLKENINGQE